MHRRERDQLGARGRLDPLVRDQDPVAVAVVEQARRVVERVRVPEDARANGSVRPETGEVGESA